jgi:hypothetical protein
MSIEQKKSEHPETEAKIVMLKGGNANWFVKSLIIKANSKVTWRCGLHTITLLFPKDHTPLAGGKTEILGKNGKATAEVGSKKGIYQYCILVTDEAGVVHLVEGNSPPTMVIQ